MSCQRCETNLSAMVLTPMEVSKVWMWVWMCRHCGEFIITTEKERQLLNLPDLQHLNGSIPESELPAVTS